MTQMTPGLASGQVNWFKFGAPTNPPVTHATQVNKVCRLSVRVRALARLGSRALLLSLSFDNFVVNALLLAACVIHVLCIAGGTKNKGDEERTL